jgi:hypothetical protein
LNRALDLGVVADVTVLEDAIRSFRDVEDVRSAPFLTQQSDDGVSHA